MTQTVTEVGTPGTLSITFDNTSTANLLGDLLTPTYFGLKVVAVELVDEADSRRVAIWVNTAY